MKTFANFLHDFNNTKTDSQSKIYFNFVLKEKQ